MIIKESIDLGGKTFSIEVGKLAKQAHGAVVIRQGDTMLLVTCTGSEEPKPDQGFFPLTVDYRENFYAGGRFPGGFFKREGRASTKEILVSRMIDRPMRPMFDDKYLGETQIQAMVISYDGTNEPDYLAISGGPAAAYLSNVPFPQPLAGVRVGMIDGEFVVNPSMQEREKSTLDLMVAGTKEAIVMVEAGAEFISEEQMVEALVFGHENIVKICELIERVGEQMELQKWEMPEPEVDEALYAEVEKQVSAGMLEALQVKGKHAADRALKAVKKEMLETYAEDEDKASQASKYFSAIKEKVFRNFLLTEGKRTDGRAMDEVRPIWCEVSYLPSVHGSAIFTRGETQALVSLTLGSTSDSQIIDSLQGEYKNRFMLHYNFPSFSVGEVRPNRGPGRREIGHGALAERALRPVLPAEDSLPYTMRLVSEILESNGSSSMASVCGGCLALLDAGIPLSKPVAGVAMGLVMEGDKYVVLTDIQGAEDHYGDMDFKVTGTDEGITALQMDIKIKGLTKEILAEALEQARQGRLHILGEMAKTMAQPREHFPEHAPQLVTMAIPVDKIRDVIGQGGKVIRGIIEKTGVKIDIDDDGSCNIFSPDANGLREAKKMIEELIAVPEVDKSYLGKVKRIVDFGAFVEILPGTEGLLHISEIANYRVRSVSDEIQEGQEIMVKVLSIEPNGRMRLSRKALLDA